MPTITTTTNTQRQFWLNRVEKMIHCQYKARKHLENVAEDLRKSSAYGNPVKLFTVVKAVLSVKRADRRFRFAVTRFEYFANKENN